MFDPLGLGRNKTGDLQGVVENLFWPVHVKDHVRIIKEALYSKIDDSTVEI